MVSYCIYVKGRVGVDCGMYRGNVYSTDKKITAIQIIKNTTNRI